MNLISLEQNPSAVQRDSEVTDPIETLLLALGLSATEKGLHDTVLALIRQVLLEGLANGNTNNAKLQSGLQNLK
jgi:hypothetical protein